MGKKGEYKQQALDQYKKHLSILNRTKVFLPMEIWLVIYKWKVVYERRDHKKKSKKRFAFKMRCHRSPISYWLARKTIYWERHGNIEIIRFGKGRNEYDERRFVHTIILRDGKVERQMISPDYYLESVHPPEFFTNVLQYYEPLDIGKLSIY